MPASQHCSIAFQFVMSLHPRLDRYRAYVLEPDAVEVSGLRVMFLGVSTLLFDDGETLILTDGFFTRPSKWRTLFTRIKPDQELIARCLERAGIKDRKLSAIIVAHSHYDHALDSPVVAQQTEARLIGSESTANIARGYGLPDEQIELMHDGSQFSFGKFTVKIVRSGHVPSPFITCGSEITTPLHPPAHARKFLEGGTYSILIEHEGKTMLVQSSAGFKQGALAGEHAEVIFLGVGMLGRQQASYRNDYWREVAQTVNAQRVIPIHWDDITKPLDQPLVPLPRLVDNFDATMEFLLGQSKVDVKLLDTWVKVNPFAGLATEP